METARGAYLMRALLNAVMVGWWLVLFFFVCRNLPPLEFVLFILTCASAYLSVASLFKALSLPKEETPP